MENFRKNHQITARQVRVVKADGSQLGVMDTSAAIRLAQNGEVDLIEIVPNATPPVCKLIEYAKLMYDVKKREKEEKRKQRETGQVKDIQLRPNIHEGDLQTKTRLVRQFLESSMRVRIVMSYKGREVTHREVGQQVIDKLLASLNDVGVIEGMKNDHNSIIVNLRSS